MLYVFLHLVQITLKKRSVI